MSAPTVQDLHQQIDDFKRALLTLRDSTDRSIRANRDWLGHSRAALLGAGCLLAWSVESIRCVGELVARTLSALISSAETLASSAYLIGGARFAGCCAKGEAMIDRGAAAQDLQERLGACVAALMGTERHLTDSLDAISQMQGVVARARATLDESDAQMGNASLPGARRDRGSAHCTRK